MVFPPSPSSKPNVPVAPKGYPGDDEIMQISVPENPGPTVDPHQPPDQEEVSDEHLPGNIDRSIMRGNKSDPLAPSRERIALLVKAIQGSKVSRRQFNDEFSGLTAVQLVRERIEAKGIPASDPISIFIEICGIYDLRQRDCIVSLAALLETNEGVLKVFLELMETYASEIQGSRDASEDAKQLISEVLERADLLLVHLDHAAKVYPTMFNRLEHLFAVLNQRSGLNVILNWLTPVVVVILTWIICWFMYSHGR